MGQMHTDLQIYDEISNIRCDLYSKCNTSALLHRIESLWPKMLVQPSDGTKIWQVWHALHPDLRKQLVVNPSNQQQWAVYANFRQYVVSAAPHFNANVQPLVRPFNKRQAPYQPPPPPPKRGA